MKILVTGGCGFIGSNLVRFLHDREDSTVINLDKLTYAGNPKSLADLDDSPRYRFVHGCITDAPLVREIFSRETPDAILNLAAESHVDRSIDGPGEFIQTNIVGTSVLLAAAQDYHQELSAERQGRFRFLHVSTDEVYGSLGDSGFFTENTRYDPRSPYAATKASSDHLVRAWHETFGLPVLITNCSNNFGPYQFPEKLIPLVIIKALSEQAIPVYGKGENVRDWLYVTDHVRGLDAVLKKGKIGETYNIGGSNEMRNIDLVRKICGILDDISPRAQGQYEDLIEFVTDRPGHDFRYAIDAGKIETELGWHPTPNPDEALRSTVVWYLENRQWWRDILDNTYQLQRLGKAGEGDG